jgi:hypothetical protein
VWEARLLSDNLTSLSHTFSGLVEVLRPRMVSWHALLAHMRESPPQTAPERDARHMATHIPPRRYRAVGLPSRA